MKQTQENNKKQGFTLIELLVVVAIISLLSSVVMIALMTARQKSRDVKRLTDMAQMNTALELYFATNKGYPSSSTGIPDLLVPSFASTLPKNPQPPDGGCELAAYPSPVPGGNTGAQYYYYPSGTSYVINGATVYPDYAYYFCLGNTTGNFAPGVRVLTPKGVK